MDCLISTEHVCKIYNLRQPDEFKAIDDVSLDIGKGEVVALKGPSGSGKTTLLSLIGCMGRPTSGKIRVAGRDVAKLPERFLTRVRRQTFGFIFQQFNLIRDIDVLENILLPLYPVGTPFSAMQEAINYLDVATRVEAELVITSYSIHYTKLYDFSQPWCATAQWHGTGYRACREFCCADRQTPGPNR